MTEAFESAHVRLILADYAVTDAGGKVTIVGGGISIVGINPQTRNTAPFSIVAVASFDPDRIGESPAVELSLETDDGELVSLPGQGQPLRIAASEKLNPPILRGVNVPNDAVRPKTQIIMQFQNGLPLRPGTGYQWRVRIDQDTRAEWVEPLYVPMDSAPPVVG